MVEVRPVEDRDELRRLFDVLGAEVAERIDSRDFRFGDLDTHFPDDRRLMLAAIAEDGPVGGALAFRNDDNSAVLRIIAMVEGFRHRGIGRRLVERIESEARLLGMEAVGLGTDEAVSFWFHLGYTPNLLFQWVYEPEEYEREFEALLTGPLRRLHHWRSSFNDTPQLFVELDEPRLDLLATVRDAVEGCHVGLMMSKKLHAAAAASPYQC
jgi:GNAT superfamily N-acetyltransferase